MGKHLRVDTLDAVDDQAKASGPYLGGCSYCNSRPAGLDQGDLYSLEVLEGLLFAVDEVAETALERK